MKQTGFFDVKKRLARLSGLGDQFEVFSRSWFPVAHHLADAGVTVARVKGKRVKALRRYLSQHAKTDMADAHILAAMPSFGGSRLDPSPYSRSTKSRSSASDQTEKPLSERDRGC